MTHIQYINYVQDKNKIYKEFKEIIHKNTLLSKSDQHWSYCIQQDITAKRGFKIHLSATIQNASLIAELFFNYLKKKI